MFTSLVTELVFSAEPLSDDHYLAVSISATIATTTTADAAVVVVINCKWPFS